MDQSGKDTEGLPASAAPSITVDRLPTRTVAPHGIPAPELNRLGGAGRLRGVRCSGRRGVGWVDANKGTARPTIADIQKRITRLQSQHGLRPYNVTTFETRGGLHAHIVFLGNREIVERLKSSTVFGE